jgi:hypothetical protein
MFTCLEHSVDGRSTATRCGVRPSLRTRRTRGPARLYLRAMESAGASRANAAYRQAGDGLPLLEETSGVPSMNQDAARPVASGDCWSAGNLQADPNLHVVDQEHEPAGITRLLKRRGKSGDHVSIASSILQRHADARRPNTIALGGTTLNAQPMTLNRMANIEVTRQTSAWGRRRR